MVESELRKPSSISFVWEKEETIIDGQVGPTSDSQGGNLKLTPGTQVSIEINQNAIVLRTEDNQPLYILIPESVQKTSDLLTPTPGVSLSAQGCLLQRNDLPESLRDAIIDNFDIFRDL